MESMIAVGVKQAIFWLAFLYFPAMVLLVWGARRHRDWRRWASMLVMVPLSLLAYARFVEPRLLVTAETDVTLCGEGLPGTVRIAVASDFHIGIFPNAVSVSRIVETVARGGADLLLIPGDFTYHLPPEKMDPAFSALGRLDIPVVAVMGNHDEGIPGPNLVTPLAAILVKHGVNVLNPNQLDLRINGKHLRIVGTRDFWASQRDDAPLGPMPNRLDMATIYLQHNPDVLREAELGAFDLVVAGHTHGGQIRLPWLTCALTLACDTLRYGLADLADGQLFVTSGTGMVGLPMRFGVPPKVDFLNVTIDRCRIPVQPMMLHPTRPRPVPGGRRQG